MRRKLLRVFVGLYLLVALVLLFGPAWSTGRAQVIDHLPRPAGGGGASSVDPKLIADAERTMKKIEKASDMLIELDWLHGFERGAMVGAAGGALLALVAVGLLTRQHAGRL